MNILLHICCAPCSIYPFSELLKDKKSRITGFFYNPNIHPAEEYEKRRKALAEYAEKEGFEVLFGGYDAEDFFNNIGENQETPMRCRICWRMRLEKTAEAAKAKGFDAFTTTLLVSPYQDQDAIARIGNDIGAKSGIKFMAIDFREGFRGAQQEAKEHSIYRQKYCGCVFSEKERAERRK